MTYYIGSKKELPLIAFDKENPAFHTTGLSEEEKIIYKHMSLPNILYFGSELGCGCGFRYALLDGEEWLNVINESEDSDSDESTTKNHLDLNEYIKTQLGKKEFVEIYGCWDGDIVEPSRSIQEINVDDLINKDFYFRERGFYIIKNGG